MRADAPIPPSRQHAEGAELMAGWLRETARLATALAGSVRTDLARGQRPASQTAELEGVADECVAITADAERLRPAWTDLATLLDRDDDPDGIAATWAQILETRHVLRTVGSRLIRADSIADRLDVDGLAFPDAEADLDPYLNLQVEALSKSLGVAS